MGFYNTYDNEHAKVAFYKISATEKHKLKMHIVAIKVEVEEIRKKDQNKKRQFAFLAWFIAQFQCSIIFNVFSTSYTCILTSLSLFILFPLLSHYHTLLKSLCILPDSSSFTFPQLLKEFHFLLKKMLGGTSYINLLHILQ